MTAAATAFRIPDFPPRAQALPRAGRVQLRQIAVQPGPRARLAMHVLRWLFRGRNPDFSNPLDLRRIRKRVAMIDRASAVLGIGRSEKFTWSRSAINDVRVRWIVPTRGRDSQPASVSPSVLLYLHGGAFVFRALNGHMNLAASIARQAGIERVVLPIYRLAPEHPFPAGLEDCLAVYRGLLQSGIPAHRICLTGDSAGGGLALKLMMRLREEGWELPSCAALISPFTDLSFSGESVERNARIDPMFGDIVELHARFYHGERSAQDPCCSPLFGDFRQLPPLLAQAGSTERLLDDSLRLLPAVERAGGELQVEVWNQMPHVWHVMNLPESRQATASIARFLRAHVARAQALRASSSPATVEPLRPHRVVVGRRLLRARRRAATSAV
jgi:epsilon-lactone hydrolase